MYPLKSILVKFRLTPFLLIFVGVCLWGCKDEAQKCAYPPPVAIFSDSMSFVSSHAFKLEKRNASESVAFENGLQLELDQSGCDHIKQTFQFTTEKPGEGDPNWFFLTAQQFEYVSRLSPKFMSLSSWAELINMNASQFRLSEPLEIENGFFVKIDKIDSGKNVILTAELSEGLYKTSTE